MQMQMQQQPGADYSALSNASSSMQAISNLSGSQIKSNTK